MLALYIIAGIIALFALLLSFNLSVRVIFDSSAKEDMKVYAKIGFYKINIIPAKPPKEKKPKKIKTKKPSKTVKEEIEETKPKEKKKFTIPAIFALVKEIGTVILKRIKKHFKVKIYSLNVILGSEEAEKTALMYGAAAQSASYLYEFLDYNFKILKKPGKIKIIPDFSKTETQFNINIKFYMRLSHITAMGIAAAMKFIKCWFGLKKTETAEIN